MGFGDPTRGGAWDAREASDARSSRQARSGALTACHDAANSRLLRASRASGCSSRASHAPPACGFQPKPISAAVSVPKWSRSAARSLLGNVTTHVPDLGPKRRVLDVIGRSGCSLGRRGRGPAPDRRR